MTELERLADLILRRISAWSIRAWRLPAFDGQTRADAVYAAVTALAALTADAEGRPHRPVPRLSDAALIDQLAVMLYDLLPVARDDPAVDEQGRQILGRLAEEVQVRA